MSSPVQLSDLDLATSADDADFTLIRKSDTTDYKVTISAVRQINIPGLPALTTPPIATDLLIVSQSGTNRKCNFGSVGFVIGTQMWFYQNATPNGTSPFFWQIIPNTGDRLLAVRGGTVYGSVSGGASAGSWQQQGVGGGSGALSLSQIPGHTHTINPFQKGKNQRGTADTVCWRADGTGSTASNTVTTSSSGGGQTHNHGNQWRPYAAVGVLCVKIL